MTDRSIIWRALGPGVRAIDRQLRHRHGIFEFSDDPECIYRIQFTTARRDITLPDEEIRNGEAVVEFHWWNEHLPPVGEEGLGLAWGVRMLRKAVHTLSLMAEELETNPQWSEVRAIYGITATFAADSSQWERRLARVGYTMVPHPYSSDFVEFWERVWAWALWHTYQSGTKQVLKPSQISRTDVWMSAAELKRRFAAGGTGIGLRHAIQGDPGDRG